MNLEKNENKLLEEEEQKMAITTTGEQKMAITATEEEGEDRRIPMDLLKDEILPRIPAIDLLRRTRLVSKQWHQLISCPEFIRIHLNRSNQRSSSDGIRVLVAESTAMTYYHYAPGVNNSPSPRYFPYHPLFSGKCAVILGSSDGLICLYDEGNKKFAVFNPSMTRYESGLADKFRWLFLSNYASWFGRHPCTGEYVLVIGSQLQGSYADIRLYELKSHMSRNTRSWANQKKHGRNYKYFEPIGELLHGALHWAACTMPLNRDEPFFEKKHVIIAYNFRSNEIREIPAPAEFPFTVGVVNECLFAIFRNAHKVFEMWIMREYGVEGSWTKYANIEGFEYIQLLVPLGFSSNGDDLIVDADRKKVEKYSFRDKTSTLLKQRHSDSIAIPYVDSLVPPKRIYE